MTEDRKEKVKEENSPNDDPGKEKKRKETKMDERKKKIRRKQTSAKKLKDMKVYYVNIRGIKSKINSLNDIIAEQKPDVLGIVETMLDEKESIHIKGYEIYQE